MGHLRTSPTILQRAVTCDAPVASTGSGGHGVAEGGDDVSLARLARCPAHDRAIGVEDEHRGGAGNVQLPGEIEVLFDGIRELHVLRADRVQVVPGADGWSEAYAYTRQVMVDNLEAADAREGSMPSSKNASPLGAAAEVAHK